MVYRVLGNRQGRPTIIGCDYRVAWASTLARGQTRPINTGKRTCPCHPEVTMPTPRLQFDGLLNFHKPTGITSAKALYKVRSLTGIRKSGHAGTLDPGADGVLLLCMGKATKRVEILMDLPKTYLAAGRLDVTSKSLDSDSPHEAVRIGDIPSADQVHRAADEFVGAIAQVPPAVSALKVNGVRAYKIARSGREVSLAPRTVQIYAMNITRYEWPEINIEVSCGRGP